MFFKKKRWKWNKIPIRIRVTAWYSFFIFIFVLLFLALTFSLSKSQWKETKKENLIETVQEFSANLNEFEDYDDGIYYVKYRRDWEGDEAKTYFVEGSFPLGFSMNLELSQNEVLEYQNENHSFLYYDLLSLDNSNIWIRGILPLHTIEKQFYSLFSLFLILGPLLFLFIIWGGYQILKRAFRPMEEITNTAFEIQEKKDFSKRIPLSEGKDEIYQMASLFNNMLESLEESYEREKRFNSDVSHELRTPLSVILSESEYALAYCESVEEAKESFEKIKRQSERMKYLISQLLNLSRLEKQDAPALEKICLTNVIETLTSDQKYLLEEEGKFLNLELEEASILGNQNMIEQLFDNLLSNAIKFSKSNISISVKKLEKQILLEVKDDGPGLKQEEQEKIWNRFYQIEDSRNKEKNQGLGLGLSFVKRIAEIHSANIRIESEIGKGSSFQILFPSISSEKLL